jgi:hypothetical protein
MKTGAMTNGKRAGDCHAEASTCVALLRYVVLFTCQAPALFALLSRHSLPALPVYPLC